MKDNIILNQKYKLGETLGKGGWGTVFKAWDMESGSFVAIKEMTLNRISQAQLDNIMSEISLLQSLNHPLIVRYIDSIKTSKALYIVLEFVESGSLELVVRKFGDFPEHLIAKYMKQVLEGLAYLHDEGVIHRDIKAANILTTKTGEIKLADFGVAVRRTGSDDVKDFEPAGSPYWMAPEVIEMSGCTAKSDIWSVGCTIIELLTSKPPYFDLDTMPALFRIVQDDMPPLPEVVSPLLKDFLIKCFQREPFLRSSAKQLLGHRWLSVNLKKVGSDTSNQEVQVAVKHYNQRILAKQNEMKICKSPLDEALLGPPGVVEQKGPSNEVEEENELSNDFELSVDNVQSMHPSSETKIEAKNTGSMAATAGTEDIDDWENFENEIEVNILGVEAADSAETLKSKLDEKLALKMKDSWDSTWSLEDDPFCTSEDEDLEFNEDEDLKKDGVSRLTLEAINFIDNLSSQTLSESNKINALENLKKFFLQYPSECAKIIRRTGIVPFIEMLYVDGFKVVLKVLETVNVIIKDSLVLESFCVMGGIPATLQYTNHKHIGSVRYQATLFIQLLLNSGEIPVKMFVGVNGLSVLVDLISDSNAFVFSKAQFLVVVDCILTVLTSNLCVRIPKNDFCRLMSKAGALNYLVNALVLVSNDPAISQIYGNKIGEILLIFSKGDPVVKSYFCKIKTLKTLLNLLNNSSPQILLKILKSIFNISTSVVCIEALVSAGAINALIPLMAQHSNELFMETQQQLFSILYNLCRLNFSRQFQAAKAGIIKHLKWAITDNYALKQFALPIIFDMARSKKTRDELYKENGVIFLFSLFDQQYPWQVLAVDSLSEWFLSDKKKIMFLFQANIHKLIQVFESAKDEVLLGILEPINKIISHSRCINKILYNSNLFTDLIKRLKHPNPIIRLNLLKIVKSFFIQENLPKLLASEELLLAIKSLERDRKILVSEMAANILSLIVKKKKISSSLTIR